MENFLLYLHSCLSHCLINLSSYLRDHLHQEVLMEVLYMDHDTVEMAYVVVVWIYGPIHGMVLVGSTCWCWCNGMDTS